MSVQRESSVSHLRRCRRCHAAGGPPRGAREHRAGGPPARGLGEPDATYPHRARRACASTRPRPRRIHGAPIHRQLARAKPARKKSGPGRNRTRVLASNGGNVRKSDLYSVWLVSYYRIFMPRMAQVACPLYRQASVGAKKRRKVCAESRDCIVEVAKGRCVGLGRLVKIRDTYCTIYLYPLSVAPRTDSLFLASVEASTRGWS